MGRHADATANVGSPTYEAPLHVEKCSFSSCRAPRRILWIHWVGGQSPEGVLRLTPLCLLDMVSQWKTVSYDMETYHNALRKICFGDDDSSQLAQHID